MGLRVEDLGLDFQDYRNMLDVERERERDIYIYVYRYLSPSLCVKTLGSWTWFGDFRFRNEGIWVLAFRI